MPAKAGIEKIPLTVRAQAGFVPRVGHEVTFWRGNAPLAAYAVVEQGWIPAFAGMTTEEATEPTRRRPGCVTSVSEMPHSPI